MESIIGLSSTKLNHKSHEVIIASGCEGNSSPAKICSAVTLPTTGNLNACAIGSPLSANFVRSSISLATTEKVKMEKNIINIIY